MSDEKEMSMRELDEYATEVMREFINLQKTGGLPDHYNELLAEALASKTREARDMHMIRIGILWALHWSTR